MPEKSGLLHDFFERSVERFGSRVAIDVPAAGARRRVRITYSELRARAQALAARVRPLAGADELVAVLLPRENPGLYAAQLGILMAGAAFVGMDAAFPDVQIRDILGGAAAVITDAAGASRLAGFGAGVAVIDVEAGGSAQQQWARPTAAHLAYAIYTSGTTGTPKGVLIEHRSIVNLVAANRDYFGLSCEDRVAQCSSPAYDSSIEETWLAFASGATLVPLDDETVRLGPDLVHWLRSERISVLCPPPTLLRAMACADPAAALPDLELVYVGGEALPEDLAALWSRACWLENGYGPTETTITALRSRILPDAPITIGRPIAGASAWVLDGGLRAVADGASGELCLGGVGLARGYKDQPALTAERFPVDAALGRIYRTGDLARRGPDGAIEYLGRRDAQVKIRGYRIELGAIETHLSACAGVRAAACTVQGEGAARILVAHVVSATGEPPDTAAMKAWLRRLLPEYMVPARFGAIAALPVNAAGKLDRAQLPAIAAGAAGAVAPPFAAPATADEIQIAAAFAAALGRDPELAPVSLEDDFFHDLGGDSLSAVAVIVRLRAVRHGSWIPAVRDLYAARTVAAFAGRAARAGGGAPAEPAKTEPAGGPRLAVATGRARPALCTAVQTAWLGLELIIGGVAVYAITFRVLPPVLEPLGALRGGAVLLLLVLAGLLAYVPVSVAFAVALKRLLIGHYPPLRAPIWGGFYTRHWIVTRGARHIPWWLFQGTALTGAVLRALGARVGKAVYIHRGVDLSRGGWDLLALGDYVTVAQDAQLRLTQLDAGELVVGPIHMGESATLDIRAGMDPGSGLERNAYLGPLSSLPAGAVVPEGERWDGVPAAFCGRAPTAPVPDRGAGRELPPRTHAAAVIGGRIAGILLAWALWLAVAGIILEGLDWPWYSGRSVALGVALGAVAEIGKLFFQALSLRLGRPPLVGTVPQWSWAGIRIGAITATVEEAGRWLAGTLLWPWWLRLAGMRLGRGCEISTILEVLPSTLTLGDECFFADGIYLAGPWRHRGRVSVAATAFGRRTFLGNHAVIPVEAAWNRHRQSGLSLPAIEATTPSDQRERPKLGVEYPPSAQWPEGMFVGAATVPDASAVEAHTAWFGLPPMELPRRQVVAADAALTYRPSRLRYGTRLFWELLRFALPAGPLCAGALWVAGLDGLAPMRALWLAPALTAAAGAALALAVVALKWMLLGRTRPGQRAFWSCWCGRWDFLYVAWEFWAREILGELEGTLWLNAYLRLAGVRIGRRVALGPAFTQVVDPDMLVIADGATVSCQLQTHSFEDRILKMDVAHIHRGATLGENAILFYGADIGAGAAIAPHSVVMKHDFMPPGTRAIGVPCVPQ